MKKILVLLSIVMLCFNLIACQDFSSKATDAASEISDETIDATSEINDETIDTTLEDNNETIDTTLEDNNETIDATLEDSDKEATANEAILGTWLATGIDGFITFKENGVGEIGCYDDSATIFNWEYNKE